MQKIKKAVRLFGLIICGFIVFLMFYLALTQNSYYINTEKETTIEEVQKFSDIQKNITQQQVSSRLYMSKCSACHGKNGEGIFDDKGSNIFPAIAAKPYEFILKRVHDYKEGKVSNPLMATLLKSIKDEDLDALADEISGFKINQ
jgi:cytochrome c553